MREEEACEVDDPSSAFVSDAARAAELYWFAMLDDPVAAAAGDSDAGKVEGLDEDDESDIDAAAKEEARPTRAGSYESVLLLGGIAPDDEEVAIACCAPAKPPNADRRERERASKRGCPEVVWAKV